MFFSSVWGHSLIKFFFKFSVIFCLRHFRQIKFIIKEQHFLNKENCFKTVFIVF